MDRVVIDLYKEGVKEGLRRAARYGGDERGGMIVGKNMSLTSAIREVDDEPDQRASFRAISNFGGFSCGCGRPHELKEDTDVCLHCGLPNASDLWGRFPCNELWKLIITMN